MENRNFGRTKTVRLKTWVVREFREEKADWTQSTMAGMTKLSERRIKEIDGKGARRELMEVKPTTAEAIVTAFQKKGLKIELNDIIDTSDVSVGSIPLPTGSSPGAQYLFRYCRVLFEWATDLAARVDSEHPLLYFLGGWYRRVARDCEMDYAGKTIRFTVEAIHYRHCLAELGRAERKEMRAIADLTDETEAFWLKNPNPDMTFAAERIFLVDWRHFFESGRLGRLLAVFEKQSQTDCKVFVGTTSRHDPSPWPHPLGPDAVGRHLLLMKPDLVGGYVKREGKKYLEIISDASQFQAAEEGYEKERSNCINYVPGAEAADVRKAFVNKEKIGLWNPNWSGPAERDSDYYNKYDMHIR